MSIPKDILTIIQCCIDEQKHILYEPVLLACGHSACKLCLTEQDLKCTCLHCNTYNVVESEDLVVNTKLIESIIDPYLKQLVDITQNDIKRTVLELKSFDFDNNIHEQCKNVESQIERKIYELKIELEELKDQLIYDLRGMETRARSLISNSAIDALEESIINYDDGSISIDRFYKLQNNLMQLKGLMKEFTKSENNIYFEANKKRLDSKVIGKLGMNVCDSLFLKQRLIITKLPISYVECEFEPFCVCPISDSVLCISFFYGNKICLYSKEFQFLKSIDQIENITLNYPRGMTVIGENKLLFCDSFRHRLVLTDFGFSSITSIGKMGKSMNEFLFPYDVLLHDGFVYVCDSGNQRIIKYTSDLVCLRFYQLNYNPIQIKAINDTILIRDDKDRIKFYNAKTFSYMKGSKKKGLIATIGSNFVQIDNDIIHFYDSNGTLNSSIRANNLQPNNGDACLFNGNFIITGKENKFFIIDNLL